MQFDDTSRKCFKALKPAGNLHLKSNNNSLGPIYKVKPVPSPSLKTLSTALRCRPFTFQETPYEPRVGLRIQAMVGHQQEDRHRLANFQTRHGEIFCEDWSRKVQEDLQSTTIDRH